MKNVTKTWFKEKEPISKLTIAHKYCGWLETFDLSNGGGTVLPESLTLLKDLLKLESKVSKNVIIAESSD